MASELPDKLDPSGDDLPGNQLFGQVAAAESLRVIGKLTDAGFVAYLAGGCVRDALLGREPKDFDVATNATPDTVRQIFGRRSTLAFGASFGVIGVLPPRTAETDSLGETTPTEVATFRSDGSYSDGRRPDSVQFGKAEEDAQRRDFTINGMFYDPAQQQVIDFVGGKQDLKDRLLRTIGTPADRFDEDKLRMLRAVRFATTLQLDVEQETIDAIRENSGQIQVVSGERIGAEMRKVLSSPHAADGLEWLKRCELVGPILPQLSQIEISFVAKALATLETRNIASALGCLLLRHPEPIASLNVLTKLWKLSNEEHRRCKSALVNADTLINANEKLWSELQPVLMDRDIQCVIQVANAIAIAEDRSTSGVQAAKDAAGWPEEKLNPTPLLTGDDLRNNGYAAGPLYKQILSEVRRAQLDGEMTTQDEAFALATSIVANASRDA
jgi:tRNA nucleotidyltransferase (CCA-adding enzyme)